MSRRPTKVLLVLFLCVVAIGFYRHWFALSNSRDTQSNKVNINLTVDPDRVQEDAETVKEKATELTGKITEEAKELEEAGEK